MRTLYCLTLFTSLLTIALADYECFCIYNVEIVVYPRPQIMNRADLGTLYDDCKPTYQHVTTEHSWQAIQFEKQIGYVKLNKQTQIQTCPGQPDPSDVVTSSAPATIKNVPTSTTYVTSQAIRHTSIASSFVTSTSTSRTTFTAKLPLQCPPQVPRSRNLKEFSNHCYEFILGIHEKWPEAELDCNHRGGHLVSIGSSSEQNFIYRTLRELHFHGDTGVWLGLTDQDAEAHWRWSSGESVVFKFWDQDQPGVFDSIKDCAMMDMRSLGLWTDQSCSGFMFNPEKHGYICEFKMI